MGTLGGGVAFFLGGTGLAVAMADSTAGGGSGLGMAGAGGSLAGDGLVLDLAIAGEEILACSRACARSSDRTVPSASLS